MNTTRIAVFYDGNFLLHSSNYYNYVHYMHKRLSINGIHKYILGYAQERWDLPEGQCRISEAHYFRGRLNAADASTRGTQLYNDRVFDDILMSEGVVTHYLPLRNTSGRREESGTNVWLSLEAHQMAIKGQMDIAVLVVADTDYVPLMRKLATQNIKTVIMGWDFEYTNDEGVKMTTRTSQELRNIADESLQMTEIIDNGLEMNNPLINGIFVGMAEMK